MAAHHEFAKTDKTEQIKLVWILGTSDLQQQVKHTYSTMHVLAERAPI